MLFKNKEKISNSPALQAQPTIYKSRLSLSPPKPRVGNKNSGIEQVINKCITEQFNSKLALFWQVWHESPHAVLKPAEDSQLSYHTQQLQVVSSSTFWFF